MDVSKALYYFSKQLYYRNLDVHRATDLHLVRFCPFGFSAELDNKESVCIVLRLWGCNLCLCIIILLLSYFEMKSSWNYIICELPGKVSPSCAPWNLGVLKHFCSCLPGECHESHLWSWHIINLRATLRWFWNSLISNKTTVVFSTGKQCSVQRHLCLITVCAPSPATNHHLESC